MTYLSKTLAPITVALASVANLSHAACDLDAGIALFQNANYLEAKVLLNECVKEDKHAAQASFYIGIGERNQKSLDSARSYLQRAVRLMPENLTYQLELSVTLEWLGQLHKARSLYQQILHKDETNLSAAIGLARMEHWLGYVRDSIKRYEDLLVKHPNDVAVKIGLAYAKLADQKLAISRKIFEEILSINPSEKSATQGLTMLAGIQRYQLDLSAGEVSGESLGSSQQQVSFTANQSYQLRWGLQWVKRQQAVVEVDASSISIDRSVQSAATVFANYRFNAQTSTFLSFAEQKLPEGYTQNKFQLELSHKLANGDSVIAAIMPSYVSGDLMNVLAYTGYTQALGSGWNRMGQIYLSHDKQFGDSEALSVSMGKTYGKQNFFRVGASASRSEQSTAQSIYGNVVHFINKGVAFKAGAVKNLSTNELALTIGVTYAF